MNAAPSLIDTHAAELVKHIRANGRSILFPELMDRALSLVVAAGIYPAEHTTKQRLAATDLCARVGRSCRVISAPVAADGFPSGPSTWSLKRGV